MKYLLVFALSLVLLSLAQAQMDKKNLIETNMTKWKEKAENILTTNIGDETGICELNNIIIGAIKKASERNYKI